MTLTDPILAANDLDVESFGRAILAWYDRHARILPWRAKTGTAPNPYHVWLSEIMLQQTTVQAVIPYFLKFIDRWPTVEDLAAADPEDVKQAWAGLGYYARARNLLKCAQVIAGKDYKGIFPRDQESLQNLPGIGGYTSAAIAAIAFNQPANVVDGNVERVMARLFAVKDPLPSSKSTLKKLAGFCAEGGRGRPGDYAQALMDLGATVCIPKTPRCGICPVQSVCKARKDGLTSELPLKMPKGQKPFRTGFVYWIENAKEEILIERRPENGLLGGMLGLPTSEWSEKVTRMTHPSYIVEIEEKRIFVRHSFTHFDLELSGVRGKVCPEKLKQTGGNFIWLTKSDLRTAGLPTVFRKAVKLWA